MTCTLRRLLPMALLLALGACGGPELDDGAVGQSRSGLFYSQSTSTRGYYQYPPEWVFFDPKSCFTNGGRIFVQALDVPNRFTIRDADGNFVTSTQWLGNATYSGPWGRSLPLTNPSAATLTVTRPGVFQLIVETSAQTITDTWEATSYQVNCNIVDPVDPRATGGRSI